MASGDTCNIWQVQDIPSVVLTPSVIKLSECHNRSQQCSRVFRGSLSIENKGKRLAAYKVMSDKVFKIKIKPSHGIVEPGKSLNINISAKGRLDGSRKTKPGILILVTACQTGTGFHITDLPSFWKKLVHHGSLAFVEVIKVDQFWFYNGRFNELPGNQMHSTIGGTTNNNNFSESNTITGNSDNASNEASSTESIPCSSPGHFETDSEDLESDGSEFVRIRRQTYRKTMQDMEKLSGKLHKVQNEVKHWCTFMGLFFVFILIKFIQKNFEKFEIGYLMINRKQS